MFNKKGLFDGNYYNEKNDKVRLTKQLQGVYNCIRSGSWQTVQEIADITNYPQASISAQLRNLRKERFGGMDVEGRYRSGTRIFEYKLNKNKTKFQTKYREIFSNFWNDYFKNGAK